MPGPTSNSIFSSTVFQKAITEVLNKDVSYQLSDIDPVFRKGIASSQGVIPVNQLGRDLKIIRTFHGAVTGEVEMSDSEVGLYGDPNNVRVGPLFRQGNFATNFNTNAAVFPTGLNGANARPYQLGVHMKEMKVGLALTMGEMSADALPASIVDVVAPKMRGFARNIAYNVCNQMYVNQALNYKLCTIATKALVQTVVSNDTLRITPGNYAVNRFTRGMRVSFVDISDSNNLEAVGTVAYTWAYVTKVDPLRNFIEIMAADGTSVSSLNSALTAGAAGTGDLVILAGQKNGGSFGGIAGFNSWMKFGTDGTNYADTSTNEGQRFLLGAERDTAFPIDVDQYPEFKSLGIDMGGQPLTEHSLRKILRRWRAAKEPLGQSIDHLTSSDGVWLAYEAQKIGREYIDRTNRLSSLSNEGSKDSDPTFTMDGEKYTTHTSYWVEDGSLYGTKLKDGNWKKMVPPQPKGLKRFDQAESFTPVDFVAPLLTGTSSIHLPLYSTANGYNQLTDYMQMPGMMRMQLVPDQPAGLKIVNCASDRTYSVSSGTSMDIG